MEDIDALACSTITRKKREVRERWAHTRPILCRTFHLFSLGIGLIGLVLMKPNQPVPYLDLAFELLLGELQLALCRPYFVRVLA